MKKVLTILIIAAGSLIFIFSSKKIKTTAAGIVIPLFSVDRSDTSFHIVNGIYYFGQELFSGTITDIYANGKRHHEIKCWQGKEESWTLMYYPDGQLAEKRYYHLGEKDSVHTGWWENGKLRFEYHFTSGLYHGDYKEWYNSGRAYKHLHYNNGLDDWGKGWRENGKPFMNYTMRSGRRYGIVNSNLCYTVKNDKGEFVNSK